jgi:hypothetical protein
MLKWSVKAISEQMNRAGMQDVNMSEVLSARQIRHEYHEDQEKKKATTCTRYIEVHGGLTVLYNAACRSAVSSSCAATPRLERHYAI